MNIPRDFIDLLLTRIDVVELINTFVPLKKKSGSNYFARCPFHNERSASFSVSQPKQFYYCFGCGAHGNAIDFIIQHEHLSFPEAIETLAQHAGMELPKGSAPSPKDGTLPQLYDVMNEAAVFYYEHMRKNARAITYLKSRGISGGIAKRFTIGYAPKDWGALLDQFSKTHDKKTLCDAGLIIKKNETNNFYDRFRDRIIFPIQDYRGRVIGFGGRIIDQGEPKYLNSPETPLFQKGHELYGLYHVLKTNRRLKSILIVEGYMDVIALFQHGVTNAVATLGTATTSHHIERLLRYTSEIIFCFDGDNAGRTAAWRAVQTILPLMQDEIQVRFLFLPEGEDPDTIIRKQGKAGFEKHVREALSLSTFLFQTLAKESDMSHIEGRARFAAVAAQHIKQIPSGMYQSILLEELSKRARIDINDIKQNVKSTKNTPSLAKSSSNAPHSSKTKMPSPIRLAITLLIQKPELIEYASPLSPFLQFPGASFFAQLIEIIQKDPHITTGRLIEHWRGEKEGEYIATLAKTKPIVPDEGIKNEFVGAMRQLLNLGLEEEINGLLAKAAQDGLTQDEKHTLSDRIGKKKALFEENR